MEFYFSAQLIDVTNKCAIVLDEIQLLPEVVNVVKSWYDTDHLKFIVTGSSSFYLKNRFSESLAGRKQTFELNTLSFDEFLRFKDGQTSTFKKFSFHSYLEGFYSQFKSYYN